MSSPTLGSSPSPGTISGDQKRLGALINGCQLIHSFTRISAREGSLPVHLKLSLSLLQGFLENEVCESHPRMGEKGIVLFQIYFYVMCLSV